VPRLVLVATGPRLVVGRFEHQWLIFEPAFGVVLRAEVAPGEVPALALRGLTHRAP
jgi:hypothetical protein